MRPERRAALHGRPGAGRVNRAFRALRVCLALLLCAGYLLNGVHFHILTTRFPHLNAADLLWGYLLQYYVNLSKKARGIFLFFLFPSHFILLSPLIFSKKVDILYAFSPFRPFFRTFCTISTFCPVFLPSGAGLPFGGGGPAALSSLPTGNRTDIIEDSRAEHSERSAVHVPPSF